MIGAPSSGASRAPSDDAGRGTRLRFSDLGLLFGLTVGVRLLLALARPGLTYDSGVYFTTALNIIDNGCVSISPPASGACLPSWGGNHLPGYPAFIAAVLTVFNGQVAAVLVLQTLITGLAMVWLAVSLLRVTGSRRISLIAAGLVAGSPVGIPWSRMLLVEALLIACSIWLAGSLLKALADRRLGVLNIAPALITGTFVRPDFVLFALPVTVVAFACHRWQTAISRLAMIAVLTIAPLGAWWVRSVRLGLPSVPPLPMADGRRPPTGSLNLLKTWLTHDDQYREWHWPMLTARYEDVSLRYSGIDSMSSDYERIQELLLQLVPYTGSEVPEAIDRAFDELATERRNRSALRTWITIPAASAWHLWTDALPASPDGWSIGAIGPGLSRLAAAWKAGMIILLLTAGSFISLARRQHPVTPFVVATLAILGLHTAFLAFGGMVEPRYALPVVPFMEVAVVLSLAGLLGTSAQAHQGELGMRRSHAVR